MEKRILITGCARSGTRYVSILLRRAGIDVQHEQMGKDGISSWLFGSESAVVPWGPRPIDYSFEYIFHLLRNPLSCIPSIATLKKASWRYISQRVSFETYDSLLLRSAKYWLHWNGMVEKKTDIRLKIEDMPGAMEIICDRVGSQAERLKIGRIPNDINTRRYGRLFHMYETRCLDFGIVRDHTFLKMVLSRRPPPYDDLAWADIVALDPLLAEKIRRKALDYGYE